MLSIFISSTFNDMHIERDILRQRVLPRLQKIAAQYGESIRFIDLRWGINTADLSEKEATKRIIDMCFAQIDKCDGRMICLLGNRYGWVPEYDLNEIFDIYNVKLSSRVSITELEIQYGVLQRNSSHKSLVFIRDKIHSLNESVYSDYNEDDIRLDRLKNEIKSSPNCICENYSFSYIDDENFSGLDVFEEKTFLKLKEYIISEFDTINLDPHKKLKKYFDSYIDSQIQKYYSIDLLENQLKTFLNSQNSFCILKSDSGMGKSAFVSHLCNELRSTQPVFYFFCGYNTESETPYQLLRYLICHLCDYLGISEKKTSSDINENIHLFSYLLEQIQDNVLIAVDGIDHLICSSTERVLWIPWNFSDKVKFVLTTSKDDRSYEFLSLRTSIQIIDDFRIDKPEKFINHLLLSSAKEFDQELLGSALSEHKIDNYYYAKMISDTLILIDRYDFKKIKNSGDGVDAINSFVEKTVKETPKNIEGLALFLLHDYGRRIAPKIVPEIYIYIACCPKGLRAVDLEALLGDNWDDVSFESYIAFLSGIIIEKGNGCYDFASTIVRNAVEKIIKPKHIIAIIEHFESLSDNDPFKLQNYPAVAFCFHRYDAVCNLILSNPTSEILQNNFISALNYFPEGCETLLREYNLYNWFFDYIVINTTTIQERETCQKIIEDNLESISDKWKIKALEFLADSFSKNHEYKKAAFYYESAANIINEGSPSAKGRLYHKFANAFLMKDKTDYEILKNCLKKTIVCFEKNKESLDFYDKILLYFSKYQLLVLEMNGFISVEKFDLLDMKISDEQETPFLRLLAFQKKNIDDISSPEHRDMAVEIIKFCTEEVASIIEESSNAGDLEKIVEPLLSIFDVYAMLSLPHLRMENLKLLKTTVENSIKNKFNLKLFKLLGYVAYKCASFEDDVREQKKQYLLTCCSIWGQFITQLELPEFSDLYIMAEEDLLKIFLLQKDFASAENHLDKLTKANYDCLINKLKIAFIKCKRYPDEMRLSNLNQIRNQIANVRHNEISAKLLWDKYAVFQLIDTKLWYYCIVAKIYNSFENLPDWIENAFDWMYDVYNEIKITNKSCDDDKHSDREDVCKDILVYMYRLLHLINIYGYEKFYDAAQYYDNLIYVLEELHNYKLKRLEKIVYGFLYGKALIAQADLNILKAEGNYSFASEIFHTLQKLLYEGEVTPNKLIYPTVSLKKIKVEMCSAKIKLAMHYMQTGKLELAAKIYETVIVLSLNLVGTGEDSENDDDLYIKTSLMANLQLIKIYSELQMKDKKMLALLNYNKILALLQ